MLNLVLSYTLLVLCFHQECYQLRPFFLVIPADVEKRATSIIVVVIVLNFGVLVVLAILILVKRTKVVHRFSCVLFQKRMFFQCNSAQRRAGEGCRNGIHEISSSGVGYHTQDTKGPDCTKVTHVS